MKVLVIPDVHLKPWMFERANEILKKGVAERAVCLGDIPDDWNTEFNIDEYEKTYDAAISFIRDNPTALFCWGNHCLSYRYGERESGYSSLAREKVVKKQFELMDLLDKYDNFVKCIHRIDNVLFSHAGVTKYYVEEYVGTGKIYENIEYVIDTINNSFSKSELWLDMSVVWARPQLSKIKMYKPRKLLQVVGHTPMKELTKKNNLLSVDVSSTYRDGRPIGTQEFLLLDTLTWEFSGIK